MTQDPNASGSLIGRVVLGRYRALCLLARGGMGEVYLARSEGALGFHRPVVIKRVLAQYNEDKTMLDLFRREARVMSNLRHPNIVSVLDFGQDGSDHVMVIEYVHGFHLGRWLEWSSSRRPFPVERAVAIVLEVLEALENAHTARGADGAPLGIVHRDVSPGNVLIDTEGVVKLADFGVARLTGEHTEVDGDKDQVALRGKFPYLSPELFDGSAATPASDTYSAAVVLDEVLRGTNAFRERKMIDTVTKVLKHTPPGLDTVRGDVSPALAAVMRRALAKKVEDRFASAALFAAALREVRSVTADEAKRELATAAHTDFLDPRMATTLGTAQLTELEALWHHPSPTAATAATIRVANEPTATETFVPGARARNRLMLALGITGVLAATAIAVLVWVATRPPDLVAGAPVVILVDHAAPRDASTAPVAHDAGAVALVAAPPTTVSPPATETTHHSGRAGIEAPFRAHSVQISRCFTDHVASVEGTPELVVHFDLAADGSVRRASITPAGLEGTSLGQCLLGIARATHFAAQPGPVSFSVPLGARRVGG